MNLDSELVTKVGEYPYSSAALQFIPYGTDQAPSFKPALTFHLLTLLLNWEFGNILDCRKQYLSTYSGCFVLCPRSAEAPIWQLLFLPVWHTPGMTVLLLSWDINIIDPGQGPYGQRVITTSPFSLDASSMKEIWVGVSVSVNIICFSSKSVLWASWQQPFSNREQYK